MKRPSPDTDGEADIEGQPVEGAMQRIGTAESSSSIQRTQTCDSLMSDEFDFDDDAAEEMLGLSRESSVGPAPVTATRTYQTRTHSQLSAQQLYVFAAIITVSKRPRQAPRRVGHVCCVLPSDAVFGLPARGELPFPQRRPHTRARARAHKRPQRLRCASFCACSGGTQRS